MTKQVRNLTLSACFLAMGLILPGAFHIFGPGAGAVFLPMHIPVLLCGFICGPAYGAVLGLLTPLLSSLLTGMPLLFPTGIAMMLELLTYGTMSGLLFKKCNVYAALAVTMLAGRIVSGCANFLLLSYAGKPYALEIFVTTSFIKALPGIALQIVIIPLIVRAAVHLSSKYKKRSAS